MAERYSRVFSLAENLYTEGAPLLLAAGALLKDTQSGKLIAQLKLKAIGPKAIRAATVRLVPLDSADRPLGEALSYDYLDLNAERDAEFGAKNPIPLPQSSARAFTAAVTEVIFADKSTWTGPETPWEPLTAAETPEQALKDAELAKQYRLRFGADTVRMPAEEKDLWFCACGAVNGQAEERCHRCGKAWDELLALDPEELKAARDRRLAEERAAREAAEQKAAEERAAAQAKAKKTKKALAVTLPILLLLVAGFFLATKVLIPNSRYQKALELAEAGQYEEAIAAFEALGDYKDAPEQIERTRAAQTEARNAEAYAKALELAEAGQYEKAIAAFQALGDYRDAPAQIERTREAQTEARNAEAYASAETLAASGDTYAAARAFDEIRDYRDSRDRSFALWGQITQRETLSAGGWHTVGLRSDGTVVAVGNKGSGRCAVSSWTDIVAISAGEEHTVGLRSDGTVVAAGNKGSGQCAVSGWTDMVAVSAGGYHTVGLRVDGTVVAVGYNKYGQCEVSDWTDVVAVSAGEFHTVGLRADGTVVAVGLNDEGQCEVSGWTDVVAVSAGGSHTVGLRSDGTVVATKYIGKFYYGQCEVSGWTDVVAVSAGSLYTVGLRSDGTVVATKYTGDYYYGECDVSNWTDIVAVSAGGSHTVGLRSDGTVVAIGNNRSDQCEVAGWRGIKLPN